MKKIQGGTRLLLFILLIVIYSTHGTLLFYQINTKEFSASGGNVLPLRKDTLKPNGLPQTGIVSPSRFPRSPSASIQLIPNDKPIFFPGDMVHIKNRFRLPGDLGDPPTNWAIVQQRIGIYLFESTEPLSNDSDHQVSVITTDSDITNGTYTLSPYVALSDDLWHGWLNTSFNIPDLTTLGDINIEPGDDVTIYQYFGGNSSSDADLGGVEISFTDTFSLGGFSKIEREDPGFVNPSSGGNTFRQGEAASVKLKAESGDDVVPGVDVSWALYYNDTNTKIPNPADVGIIVNLTDVTSGTLSTTTDINGELNLTVYTTSPDTPEENYYILITGDFSPTTYYTENYDGTANSNHYSSTANFTVNNDIAAFSALAPGFEDFFRGSNTFRHGENATVTFKADAGGIDVSGVVINCTLHRNDTGAVITNESNGITFYLYDPTTGNIRNTTDGNGELNLVVNTTYPDTPENSYSFYITANFTGTGFNSPSYDGVDESTNKIDLIVNFTIKNEMDYVDLQFISAVPSETLDTPNTNITIVTFRAQALYTYGGPTDYYFPANIPVNATLDMYLEGVTLSAADGYSDNGSAEWWLTDSNGEIAFNITADFPVPFNDSILTITAVANLQTSDAPDYPTTIPHRFMRNSTDGFNASNNRVISINPDFWIGEIVLLSPSSTIRPGKSATFEFEVRNSGQPSTKFADVPVNITLGQHIDYVTLTFDTVRNQPYSVEYLKTDSNGVIEVTVSISQLSEWQPVPVILNLTVDFENDSNPRWIGSKHVGYDTIENFNKTWLFDQSTDDLEVNPEFLTGEIVFIGYNVTDNFVQPGEAAKLTFKARNSELPNEDFADVPVKFELNQTIAGVSLVNTSLNPEYLNSGYYKTDGNGIIEVVVQTTYLTTPEFRQAVKIDFTLDFENDTNVRWIGKEHTGFTTLTEYNKTWLEWQSSADFYVDPDFSIYKVAFSTTNETGDTIIRSGDALTVTFKVQPESGGTGLWFVPVNISLVGSYLGVSISFFDSNGPSALPNYEYTLGTGEITILLTTTYDLTPKNRDIRLKATANFQYDISNPVWYIGQNPSVGDFRSNYTYSDVEKIVTVAPQYFTGNIYVPTLNNPNATLVQQTETMEIEFKLKLTYTGDVFPDIDDVNISIQINNTDPADLDWPNMTVTPSLFQDSDDSSVIFYIETNTTGITPEAIYNITAKADFGTTKGLTYNFSAPYPSTVPSGYLAGVWVNGTTNDNYSFVTQWFEVKNIDRLTVVVDDVSDPLHTDEGFISGYWEVYRETTNITLSGSYKDITQQPVNNTEITISWNSSISGGPFNLTNVFTDAVDGTFSVNVSLPTSTDLDDITIYARDVRVRDPAEVRIGVTNIRVVTKINLSDYSRTGSYTGNAVHVGENVSVAGTLYDDQGVIIDSSELDDRLRVIGWNGSHEIGAAVTGSPDGVGAYNFSFQVPLDYSGDTLFIRFNITTSVTLLHYRLNYTQLSIFVYRDYKIVDLQIYLPHNSSTIPVTNNSMYLISSTGVDPSGVDHRFIFVFGNVNDTAAPARRLSSKFVNTLWNGTGSPLYIDTNGFFNTSYSFTGWNNVTWEWEFYHILDNGTILSKYYFITFEWEVYDISEPTITIINPVNFTTTQWLPNNDTTTFTVNVTDPNNAMGYVSVGVDNASVTIWINDTSYAMTQGTGSIFYYNWNTSSVEDKIYNITITASDVGGNINSTGSFMRVIDIIVPSITPSTTQYNDSYAPVSLGGILTIKANITDSNSLTLMNSGINTSSIAIWINGTSFSMTYDTGSTYIYNWDTSTAEDKIYNITFSTYDNAGNWNVTGIHLIVLDIIKPSITTNITQYNDSYVPFTPGGPLQIVADFTDSGSLTLKNSGVNTSSIAIWIDGTSYLMTYDTGSTYIYNWDTSKAEDKIYNITIGSSDNAGNWNTTGTILIVIDIIKPSITTNISQYHNTYVAFTPGGDLQIVADINDSGSLTLKNSGVDPLTIAIWIDGTDFPMTHTTGSFYVYNWDTSAAEDKVYNITIDAFDNVGNSNTTGTILIVLDLVAPTATFDELEEYPSGYLELNSEGKIEISGTINNSNSNTGINSGLDYSSVELVIRGKGETDSVLEDTIEVTAGSFSYNWDILNADFTRDSRFIIYSRLELVLTFNDTAGNSGEKIKEVQLDNEAPNLGFVDEDVWTIPNVVKGDELTVELTINDGTADAQQSGVNMTTLVIELVSNETDETIYSIEYSNDSESRITDTGTGVSVTLDIPKDVKKDVLYLKASIFDNTRNQKEIESERFTLRPISASSLTIEWYWYILGIPLALGGGVGFAALFERVKGLRSA